METMEKNTVSGTHQEKAKKMRKLRRWQIIVIWSRYYRLGSD